MDFQRCTDIINGFFYLFININTFGDQNTPSHIEKKFENSFIKWDNDYDHTKPNRTIYKIYHFGRYLLIKLIIVQIVSMMTLCYIYYIFTNHLSSILYTINNNNFDILVFDAAKYALQIFALFSIKSVLISYCLCEATYGCTEIRSCLLLCIYRKSLSLDINECDKKQVLSIIGSDIESIYDGVFYSLGWGVGVIGIIIMSIFILYTIMGGASLFGIGFMFFIGFPFQLYCGVKYSNCTKLKLQIADKRTQLIAQLIRGIRVVKVQCHEVPFMDKINEYRENESTQIHSRNLYFGFLILSNFLIPSMMLIITFIVYCFVFRNKVEADTVLLALVMLSITAIAVRAIPVLIGCITSLLVACDRVDQFMQRKSVIGSIHSEEITYSQQSNAYNEVIIRMQNTTFIWPKKALNEKQTQFSLHNISLNIKRGKLIGIIGVVGSGKTSLMQAILGEMQYISGRKEINESIVYCSQIPYIRNATLRDNIILDLAYDEAKYEQCITASCLVNDLKKLPEYDLTLVGDEGVNISGGQQMRIAFARALYRKHDHGIFIFDDPLSCVDVFVGRHMFLNGIYEYLLHEKQNNNTCLMVINSHLNLLKYFDEIIIMENGSISMHCSIKQLYGDDNILTKYAQLLPDRNQLLCKSNHDDEKELIDFDSADIFKAEQCVYTNILSIDSNQMRVTNTVKDFVKSALVEFDYNAFWFEIDDEIMEFKRLKNSKTKLLRLLIPLLIAFTLQCCLPVLDIWILKWNYHILTTGTNVLSTSWYLSIWFFLLIIVSLSAFFYIYNISDIIVKASNHVHSKSLFNILRANTLFFDVTAVGDIMNRFTSDTNRMDINLSTQICHTTVFASQTIGYLIIIFIVIPLSIIPVLLVVPIMLYLIFFFKRSYAMHLSRARQSLAPIMTLFSETVSNLESVRAYKLQSYFINEMTQRINNERRSLFVCFILYCWITFYLELLSNTLQLIIIMIVSYQISLQQSKQYYMVLLCWYFSLIQQQMPLLVSSYYKTQTYFTSVMRLMLYHDIFEDNKTSNTHYQIVHEETPINHNYQVANVWPQCGDINIYKLMLRYRDELNVVLDIDTTIEIKRGSKIGVCGRTGSGKSSILVSIFRLFEPMINSKIEIDQLLFNKLGLYHLRSNLSIITQNPILFGNLSLRFNIDLLNGFSDDEIWFVLQLVNLKKMIKARDGELHCLVEENGCNFSLGERQLICFAKSILNKSSIYFMDEATSSIDKYTDGIIQKVIRSNVFENTTVITIAHRLQTIYDYDYIMVLGDGKIVEYDTPQNLLKQKNSKFAHLAKIDSL